MKKLMLMAVLGLVSIPIVAADYELPDDWSDYVSCIANKVVYPKLKPMMLKLMKQTEMSSTIEMGFKVFASLVMKKGLIAMVPAVAAANNTTNEKVLKALTPVLICKPVSDAVEKAFSKIEVIVTPLAEAIGLKKAQFILLLQDTVKGMCISAMDKASGVCPIPNKKQPTINDFFITKFSQYQCKAIVGSKKFQEKIKGKGWLANVVGNACASGLYTKIKEIVKDQEATLGMSTINKAVLAVLPMEAIKKVAPEFAEMIAMLVEANVAQHSATAFAAAKKDTDTAIAANELAPNPTAEKVSLVTAATPKSDIAPSAEASALAEPVSAAEEADIEF